MRLSVFCSIKNCLAILKHPPTCLSFWDAQRKKGFWENKPYPNFKKPFTEDFLWSKVEPVLQPRVGEDYLSQPENITSKSSCVFIFLLFRVGLFMGWGRGSYKPAYSIIIVAKNIYLLLLLAETKPKGTFFDPGVFGTIHPHGLSVGDFCSPWLSGHTWNHTS